MNKTTMTYIQSARKRRFSNEEDSGESISKRRRYSSSESLGSRSRRHESRRKGDQERRNRKCYRHRRERTERFSSEARTRKRSSSRERRKHRRSHSRERKQTNDFTLNGRCKFSGERSPRENYVGRRYDPFRRRDRSRSPREIYRLHDERQRDYDELYEKDVYDAAPRSRGYPALKKEIRDFLRIEHHHLLYEGKEDSNGDIQDVEWCYEYLDPTIVGHITGGRAELHHRCRRCKRICLHLLGECFTGNRMCLACAARERGWKEDEVPLWYFHKTESCRHCRTRQGYYNY